MMEIKSTQITVKTPCRVAFIKADVKELALIQTDQI
jgi:hypothetical protein